MSEDMKAVDWLRGQSAVQCKQAADYIELLEHQLDEAREENKKFREALEWISKRYDDSKPTHQIAMDAYEMSCTASSVLQKEVK